MPDTAAEPDEARRVEARGVQEHPRAQGEERRGAVRLLLDDAGHGERPVADDERVAHGEPEPGEDARLDHRAASRQELVERAAGRRLDAAVEGIAGVDGLELDEEGSPASGPARHRHQLAHPGDLGAAAHEITDRRLRGGVERPGRAQLDVTPEERARLAPERAVEAGGHAQDGHESRDTEGDAREEAGEVAPRASRLPPGQGQDEARGQGGRRA